MALTLPDLPYAKNALEPYLSAKTLEFHHDKHHKTYVDTGNKLLAGTDLEKEDSEAIIKKVAGDASKAGIFNNAAQTWNHSFFWNCLKPKGGGRPTGQIAQKINADFGSYEKFAEELKNAGLTQFGSGWAWLVQKNGKLEVMKTANADTPVAHSINATPDSGRLGACLLPRLPEQEGRLPPGRNRQSDQLGFCKLAPEITAAAPGHNFPGNR